MSTASGPGLKNEGLRPGDAADAPPRSLKSRASLASPTAGVAAGLTSFGLGELANGAYRAAAVARTFRGLAHAPTHDAATV